MTEVVITNSHELAYYAQSALEVLVDRPDIEEYDPTGQFRLGLHRAVKDALAARNEDEAMDVFYRLHDIMWEGAERGEAELAKGQSLMATSTAQPPIHVHLPPLSPTINVNVPGPAPTKKVISHTTDRFGEPTVTVETAPAE